MAVTSRIFPLLEVTNEGRTWKIWKDFEPTPVRDYLKAQGRFRHLSDEEIAWVESEVEKYWQDLLHREKASASVPGLE